MEKKIATTSVYGYGGFGRDFNGNSTQLKKNGSPEVITDVFSSVLLSGFNAPVRIGRHRTEAVEGECTKPLRKIVALGLVLVTQCMGPF